MKVFSFLRPLCGVVLLVFSAAVAAEVCFENLDNIVLEDPDTQDTQTYPLAPQDIPCTEGGNLVMPFALSQRGLTCAILDGQSQPIPDPIRVALGATVPLNVVIQATTIPVTNVIANDSNPGVGNCDAAFQSVTTDPTVHGCAPVADDVINATITVSGTGVPGVLCAYNIQPDALEIFNVNPQTQAVAVGDNGVPVVVSVRSVNPGTINGVSVADNLGGSCSGPASVDEVGGLFSCDVEDLQSASPQNGVLTASGTNALDDTDTYTLEPLGLVITSVTPTSQVVNIGDTGSAVVSVRSNGGTISGVSVSDSRGGSCTPDAGTTVNDTTDTDWNCNLAALPGGSAANGTLTASATGATSDNTGYTLNPTQLAVAITSIPSCIDPGLLEFDITVTHDNTDTDVTSVPVTVSGTPAGECDQTLSNVPSTGSSYTCSFTPASLPVSGSASTSSAEANDGSDSYSVTQCQGQLPAYCSDPEHNIVLAASFISSAMPLSNPQLDFWDNGAWFNTATNFHNVEVPANQYLALPFQPPGPGEGGGDNVNNGRVQFTGPDGLWTASISDCPGDFSRTRPFTSPVDTAIDTTQSGVNWCVVGGGSFSLKWAMSSGDAVDGSVCIMLQPGFTYYLNLAPATNGAGPWVSQCTDSSCTMAFDQTTQ